MFFYFAELRIRRKVGSEKSGVGDGGGGGMVLAEWNRYWLASSHKLLCQAMPL